MSLMDRLREKGDIVFVENGKVKIRPASGKPVPNKWLKDNLGLLELGIAKSVDEPIYKYVGYSTGHYGGRPGITLQFMNLKTGQSAYVNFNVILKRQRSGSLKLNKGQKKAAAKKGAPLANKRFSLPSRIAAFYQFWVRAGLDEPPRLSSFYDYMGKLKSILFTGEISKGERLDKKTLMPFSLEAEVQNVNRLESGLPNNSHTINIQSPDNVQTTVPNRECAEGELSCGMPAIIATGEIGYGRSIQGSEVKRSPLFQSVNGKEPEHQTENSWLEEFGDA